ncbi:hypothetical protein Mapa_000752 [Marchantia paleacea]|nr:hypothetical protein Mapa_000752 [Marchantia paleacea]
MCNAFRSLAKFLTHPLFACIAIRVRICIQLQAYSLDSTEDRAINCSKTNADSARFEMAGLKEDATTA